MWVSFMDPWKRSSELILFSLLGGMRVRTKRSSANSYSFDMLCGVVRIVYDIVDWLIIQVPSVVRQR